tara:strand:+ start:12556 stop:14493 length:1938 start_codon:yes stop_codon:yes gene_type:complete
MKLQYIPLLIGFLAYGLPGISQPYVVNEKIEKVFSEGFTDINKSFIITPSSDPKFWSTYGDGYYYMRRKIASPRAVIANADPVSKNFYIKSKVNLAITGTMESSVGIIFLAQKGGKGGFVFEINKKKKFRIKDLGTNAFITKEGDNGWVKSKSIAPPTRNNTIEIKGFRGQFDIYINGAYIYSFVNSSYESGKFGTYIGPNAETRIYYFNVYNLDMPGAEPEVNLTNLTNQIEALKLENDSLKTLALTAVYGDSDKTAISAIKILEEQIQAVNKENNELKNILNEIEISKSGNELDTNKNSIKFFQKLEALTKEKDSLLQASGNLKSELSNAILIQDSLNKELLNNKTEIEFMKEQLSKMQLDMAEEKLEKSDSLTKDVENLTSDSSNITSEYTQYDQSDSISTKLNSENLIEVPDSLVSNERIPSTPSKIVVVTQLLDNSDSIPLEISAEDKPVTNDSLNRNQRIPSTPSKGAFIPNIFEKTDSIYKEEVKEKNTVSIDSVNIHQKAPSLPAKIASAPKTENIINIQDSTNTAELDTALEVKNDSLLVKLEKTPTILNKDTLVETPEKAIPLDTVGEIELIKKDSIYMHTLNIDEEIGIEDNLQNNNLETDSLAIENKPLKNKKSRDKKPKKDKKSEESEKIKD